MEEIIIRIEVDGVEHAPVKMDKGTDHPSYEREIMYSKSGHVFNKDETSVPYQYVFVLIRNKTEEELAEGGLR